MLDGPSRTRLRTPAPAAAGSCRSALSSAARSDSTRRAGYARARIGAGARRRAPRPESAITASIRRPGAWSSRTCSRSCGEKSSVSPDCGTRFSTTTTRAAVVVSALRQLAQQQVRDHAGEPRSRPEHDHVGLAHRVDRGGAGRRPGGQQADAADPARRAGDRGLAADRRPPVGLRRGRCDRPRPPGRAGPGSSAAPGRPRRPAPPTVGQRLDRVDAASRAARPAAGCRPSARPARRIPPKRCCSSSPHCASSGSAPASAARAMRRSPGGSSPSSRRIRPDEPPSSATVTTAVRSSVSSRSADSDACRPWPPPSATARPIGHAAVSANRVRSGTADGYSRPRSRFTTLARTPIARMRSANCAGHHHRAVLAAGAADREGQVVLALAGVAGADDLEQLGVAVEELRRRPAGPARSRGPPRPHRSGRAAPGSRTDSAGTGHRRPGRRRPAGRTCSRTTRPSPAAPAAPSRPPPGVNASSIARRSSCTERRTGVEHQVGLVAQAGQHGPLGGDAVDQSPLALQRMRPADVLESAHQHLVARLEEQHARPQSALGQLDDHAAQVGREGPAADVHDDGDPGDRALGAAAELDHRADQLGRQVVDDEVAEVLEALGRGAAAGAGQPGDDHGLERAAFRSGQWSRFHPRIGLI